MNRIAPLVVAAALSGTAAFAQSVPLPNPRPMMLHERLPAMTPPIGGAPATTALAPAPELQDLVYPDAVAGPSACDRRLAEIAVFTPLPRLMGPGECGAAETVRLIAVIMPDRTQVPLVPPATLRCPMAEATAHWVRDDISAAAAELGSPVKSIAAYDSYECRGRNRVVGAKISEHGRGNALDIRGLNLANGQMVDLTSPIVSKHFRERLRASTCARFTTVLGPGSDGYHEQHVHVDLAERMRGYRMCQWDVREPPAMVEGIPLPPARPAELAKRDAETKAAPGAGAAR